MARESNPDHWNPVGTLNINNAEISFRDLLDFSAKPSNLPALQTGSRIVHSDKYVKAGSRNDFFDVWVDKVALSGLASNAVSTTHRFIEGDGFATQAEPMPTMDWEEWDGILSKTALDYSLLQQFTWQVIYRIGEDKPVAIRHIDFTKLRIGLDSKDPNRMYWLYCADWSKTRYNPIIEYPSWGDAETEPTEYSANGRTWSAIYHSINYQPSAGWYQPPTYLSGIDRIELDYRIGDFHNSNVKNGLYPGGLLAIIGDLQGRDENGKPKMDSFIRQMNATHKGEGKAGKYMVVATPDKESMPQIISWPKNENDKLFIEISEQTRDYIPALWNIPPSLTSLRKAGSLGNQQEIMTEVEVYQKMIISPIQRQIERAVSRITGVEMLIQNLKIFGADAPAVSEGLPSA
jgi:hypothetical protein